MSKDTELATIRGLLSPEAFGYYCAGRAVALMVEARDKKRKGEPIVEEMAEVRWLCAVDGE